MELIYYMNEERKIERNTETFLKINEEYTTNNIKKEELNDIFYDIKFRDESNYAIVPLNNDEKGFVFFNNNYVQSVFKKKAFRKKEELSFIKKGETTINDINNFDEEYIPSPVSISKSIYYITKEGTLFITFDKNDIVMDIEFYSDNECNKMTIPCILHEDKV